MSMKLFARIKVRVPIRERVPCEVGTGFTSRITGYREATVDVEYSTLELEQLAQKAATNRSRKSRVGPLYAKAHS